MNINSFCKLDGCVAFALFVSTFFGVLSEFHHGSYYMCIDSKVLISEISLVNINLECVTTGTADAIIEEGSFSNGAWVVLYTN